MAHRAAIRYGRAALVVALCISACGGAAERTPQLDPARAPRGEPVAEGVPAPTPCAEPPKGALARLGPACGFFVIETDAGWALRSGDATASPAIPLPRPTPCLPGRCELAGEVDAERGTPVVLAALRSGLSEGAQMVWLIAPGDEARPLWLEPPVLGDGTPQGPAYELWPHRCGSGLALVPRARFEDGAEGSAAPETLAAAGWLTISDEGDASPPLPEDCVPMPLVVPW